MLKCIKCDQSSVIELQNGGYCEKHFIYYFEKKVFDTIKKYKLIKRGENVGIAVSGGKDSLTTLYLVSRFMTKNQLGKPKAIAINEGIKGYRDHTIEVLEEFCKNEQIELHITSYKKDYGNTLDEMLKLKSKEITPCSICGVLRRQSLNTMAKKLKIDVLATGHNLDDESQTILMNIFKGNTKILPRQGIITSEKEGFVKRIKPLYFLTDKEVRLYTYIKGFNVKYTECPNSKNSYREDIEKILNEFEAKYPGTKNSIINVFEQFLSKEQLISKTKIKFCRKCGEPTTKDICKACVMLQKIG